MDLQFKTRPYCSGTKICPGPFWSIHPAIDHWQYLQFQCLCNNHRILCWIYRHHIHHDPISLFYTENNILDNIALFHTASIDYRIRYRRTALHHSFYLLVSGWKIQKLHHHYITESYFGVQCICILHLYKLVLI